MHIEYNDIDSENTPFGKLLLRRFVADGETGYEILIDSSFLMASHGCHSEREMAVRAWMRLDPPRTGLSVLVGGLGAGHTLRASLDLDGVGRVLVAEIGAKVIEWNRLYFSEFNESAIDDPRIEVVISDVLEVIKKAHSTHDLILLDVDNGPGWLATPANESLYTHEGLELCREALKPGGVLAIWAPARNRELNCRMKEVFGEVEESDTNSLGRQHEEPGSVIYLSRALTTST